MLRSAWANDFLPGSPATISKDLRLFRSTCNSTCNLNIVKFLEKVTRHASGRPRRYFFLIPISDESFESIPRAQTITREAYLLGINIDESQTSN